MLRAESISKSYGSVTVNTNISLQFESGTVTAIVGDNGAGKSTLLKILAGLLRPDSGQVSLAGTTLTKAIPRLYRSAGIEMVYQNLALAKNHDVITNLFAGREITTCLKTLDRTTMRKQAQQILDSLGVQLTDLDAAVGSYSGGQQQSIAIARALLFDPKVLLFDEPTAALGAREVRRVLEIIREQARAGRVIVFVSHRLNDVMEISDRIVVLRKGRVYSDDPTGSLSLGSVIERIVS
jgi:ABC-type sugar transport system ATPase subunit